MALDESLKIKPKPGIDIDGNWETLKHELLGTNRPGIDNLVTWLETTDFKTAPASSKYHSSFVGGLADHSLNVLRFARELIVKLNFSIQDDAVVITSLLHDVCKANYYKISEVLDYEYKDKTDRWRKKEGWIVDEELPIGHGDKSVALVRAHIPLTKAEACAIRWHMGAWEVGVHSDPMISKPFRKALDLYPLVKLIMISDQLAELFESGKDSPKEDIIATQSTLPF